MGQDKVVNTRVSQGLYEKISAKARKNRISISNLIRNLVEDTLELHEELHDAVDKKILKYVLPGKPKNILGFQEISLARNTSCGNCNRKLSSGTSAYLPVTNSGSLNQFFCPECRSHATSSNT